MVALVLLDLHLTLNEFIQIFFSNACQHFVGCLALHFPGLEITFPMVVTVAGPISASKQLTFGVPH